MQALRYLTCFPVVVFPIIAKICSMIESNCKAGIISSSAYDIGLLHSPPFLSFQIRVIVLLIIYIYLFIWITTCITYHYIAKMYSLLFLLLFMENAEIKNLKLKLNSFVEGSVTQRRNSILAILRKSGLCVTEHSGLKELSLYFTSHWLQWGVGLS